MLADAGIPVPIRVGAAARVLQFVHDRPGPVRRIIRPLIAGLTPSRALDRLRQVQNQIETCEALDALIDERERRVKLVCPRCRERLPRIEMVKHLWHHHGLTLERGKTRDATRVIEELQARHAATGNAETLDSVTALAGTEGVRRWIAAGEPAAEEVAPLLTAAAERDTGVCPVCYAELPEAVPPLPAPLVLINGRLAGDGYVIEVGSGAWFRTLRITTPASGLAVGRRLLTPRGAATLLASLVLLVALALLKGWLSLGGIAVALLVYLVVRYFGRFDNDDDRAVNAAWMRLAPGLSEKARAARFLTRLVLASRGVGDPGQRVRVLSSMVARAAAKAAASDAELQLLAAAAVLQVEDESGFGRDVVSGIASLAASGFNGQQPAYFAEFVVAAYLTHERELGNLARLRVLLLSAAFEAGLVPRDLLTLWAGAPNLKHAMAFEPAHRLAMLFGLWRTRTRRAWEAVAAADTVFDLAHTSPPTAARLLGRFPDLLLIHWPQAPVDELVGPVLVCSRGVAVGGHFVADPDANVRFVDEGHTLLYGWHRLELARKVPPEFLGVIRGLLRFRAERLLPFIDGYLAPGSGDVSRRLLVPFCRRCPNCGTLSAVTCGALGRTV